MPAAEPSRPQMASAAKLTELSVLYRQLAAMYGAGLSMGSSTGMLATQARMASAGRASGSIAVRRALESIKQQVYQGRKLNQAMALWPQIFPPFHVAIIAQGEATGQLDIALARLAEITERDLALVRELKKQTFYPTVVLYFGIPVLIAAFFIGEVKLVAYGAVLLLAVTFLMIRGIGFMAAGLQSRSGGSALKFTMALPIVGAIARRVAVAYFMRALGLLYSAGVPVAQSLLYAADASGNPWLGDPVRRIVPQVEAGQTLKDALGSTGLFPPYVMASLATAQETGGLGEQLQRAAAFYEDEIARQLKLFCLFVGVFVLLVVAGLTGYGFILFWYKYYSNMIEHPFSAHSAPI